MYNKDDRLISRQTDRRTDRQTDGQTDRQTDRQQTVGRLVGITVEYRFDGVDDVVTVLPGAILIARQ